MADAKEVVLQEGMRIIDNTPSITVFVFSFGLIIVLLLYIWRDKEKQNEIRHKKNEEKIDSQETMMSKLIDLQQSQQILLAKFEAKFEVLQK